MNIGKAFPSKYLKASDLDGRAVNVVIARLSMEAAQGAKEPVPILYFVGKEKGLWLNKTNATTIANAYGVETEAWANRPIQVYPTTTQFEGQVKDCIRLRLPTPKAASSATVPSSVEPADDEPPIDEPAEDDIHDGDDLPF